MVKRLMDITSAAAGLLILSPILITVAFIVYFQDFHNPLYIAPRVGKQRKMFNMVKLRSMIVTADKSGVDSTSSDDKRITWIGHFIRRIKLDEITQLWNVLIGDMSLVGPRPNVERDVAIYTQEELHLLDVRPGITDLSSIVFSDEGDILKGSLNPDLDYSQLIRPWKSRLGILYIRHQSILLDIKLILLTVTSIISRKKALNGINRMLSKLSAGEKLIEIVKRERKLIPYPPPGADSIVSSRD
jgi:lipopolysaccharide/colanic/teichoic acid biosynthesis glycosyltransferase